MVGLLPQFELSCQDHSVPAGGAPEQAMLPSLPRLNYGSCLFLFPTISILFPFVNKRFKNMEKSSMSQAQGNGMTL